MKCFESTVLAVLAALPTIALSSLALAGEPKAIYSVSVDGIGAFIGSGPSPWVGTGKVGFEKTLIPNTVTHDACGSEAPPSVEAVYQANGNASTGAGVGIGMSRGVRVGLPAVLAELHGDPAAIAAYFACLKK